MLKKTIMTSCFLLVIIAGDRIIGFVLDHIVSSSRFRFSMVYKGGQNNDILIIGNSRAVNTFYAPEIARLTGKNVLNLGYNAMWGEMVESVFLDYLELNTPPKLLIIEITSFAEPRGRLINDMKLYMSKSTRLQKILNSANPDELFWTSVTHLYRYNNEMFLRALYYMNKSDQTWINRYKISAALLEQTSYAPPEPMKQIDANIKALERIIIIARQQGIAVKLVVAPYLPAYAKNITNLDDWISEIQALVGPDYPIYNYAFSIGNTSLLADRLHLNYDGALYLLQNVAGAGFFRVK